MYQAQFSALRIQERNKPDESLASVKHAFSRGGVGSIQMSVDIRAGGTGPMRKPKPVGGAALGYFVVRVVREGLLKS